MRFSRLSLERYGRFEDCDLDFRPGSPDLHIIYGANEAGKTTSLAAVSDLLFGFPARSPYNFLFDYALLRVGAVLEDGGCTLAYRRKKGISGTLLDASDAAIDPAGLAAMLKGQTRETFGLSFSLDQDALRSGGRAMVEAKNDIGRTLFAAGSGLTGIADELKRLESEADGIWGPSTKGSRTFTQAQRQYADATKSVRDESLKPKAWSDAKAASERTKEAVEAVRKERDGVQAEIRAAERVRRLAPLVRQRDEQIEALHIFDGTADLGRQREDAAEDLVREADEAVRQISTAEQLRSDVTERRAKVSSDPTVLAEAEEIDQLGVDAGAELKAGRDLVELETEHTDAVADVRRLREEAGVNADAAPQRAVATRLRELARVHGELQVAHRQIGESREGVDDRGRRAQAALDTNSVEGASDQLIDAVDAARMLGADADARCESTRRLAEAAGGRVEEALGRLAPWTGAIDILARLPNVGTGEIEFTRDRLAELAALGHREEEEARRSSDRAAAVVLEIEQLATGAVVSPEEISSAKLTRERHWLPLRDHLLDGAAISAPRRAVEGFEASVAAVDERSELRFANADASSRLSLLEHSKAAHELGASQAKGRAGIARDAQAKTREGWYARLSDVGLPTFEPVRFKAWQADRETAGAAHADYQDLILDAEQTESRRDATRAAMSAAMGVADGPGPIAPVLLSAERRRAGIEETSQKRALAQSELEQAEADSAALSRRQARVDADVEASANLWKTALAEASLDIDVVSCAVVLDLLDELREATAAEALLRRRMDGIVRDAREHAKSVESLANRIGIDAGETTIRLRTLRDKLATARASATLLESLDEEDRRRGSEELEAQARLKTAEESLASLMAETGSADRATLGGAIERSRSMRVLREGVAKTEQGVVEAGDGLSLDDLVAAVAASDPDQMAERLSSLGSKLEELNLAADDAATAHGDARSSFAGLVTDGTSAVDAAADVEQARSELEVLAEHYILKRTQAITLKWAIEKYRERHQDPLLLRAGELFSTLTIGRYATLTVDADGATPRLFGLRDDQRTMVEVDAMSEGTTDQLFLALRLAALEQSVTAGITLPFLADDLFVNFDDQRAEAGFRVLAEVAKSTQVLFFTHHPHLVAIAKNVVGAQMHSECALI